MANRIQLRRGTAAEWASKNPVLGDGEPGIERDTGKQKFGNGVSAWSALPYASQGPIGPAGVADDASVETLVKTPGSKTATALNATTATAINKRVDREIFDSFAGKPNGYPTTADSGQAYSLYPTSGNRKPIIKNGKLTFNVDNPGDTGGGSGGYASLPTVRPVTHADATFTLSPWTDAGGLACLAAMESDLGASNAGGLGVPRSPAHLIVAPDYWSFGVFPVAGQPIVSIKSVTYTTPLLADGIKTYSMSFDLDRVNGIAYVSVPYPDGTQRQFSFQHEAIKIAAYSAFIEPFQGTTAGKDYSLAEFTEWSVGTGINRGAQDAKEKMSLTARGQEQQLVKVQSLAANQTLTTSFASTGVAISGNWGKTGRCLFTVQVPLQVRGAADVYLIMNSGVGNVNSTSTRAWKGRPNIIDAGDVEQRHVTVMMDATGNTADPVTAAGLPFTYTLQALAFGVNTIESPPGNRAIMLSGSGHNVIITATPY